MGRFYAKLNLNINMVIQYMLKRCVVIVWALLTACTYPINAASDHEAARLPKNEPAHILINAEQKKAFRLTGNLLENHHYSHQKLALLAKDVHRDFLQALDPNHLYFLQSDIDEFKKYRNALLSANRGDLSAPVAIYERYRQRADDLGRWSLARLKQPFDLNTTDTVSYPKHKSQEKRPWPETVAQAKEQQEKIIQDQLIRLMLSGKTEKKAIEQLTSRYNNAIKRLEQFNAEDLFLVYMNVIAARFDPHSNYLSPRRSEEFDIGMRLSLEGIGAVLHVDDEKITIRELIPGGPAYKSGKLHLKDHIIGVGQGSKGEMVDIVGWRLDKAVDLIRGKKGSLVRLLVEPARATDTIKEITIKRDEVKLEEQAAKATVEEISQDGITRKIGLIKLPSFYMDFAGAQQGKKDFRSTSRDVARLLKQLKKDGVEGIVIDLRGDGGGSLYEAVQTVGLFINQGPVVMISEADGTNRVEEDESPGALYNGPLGVLIDHQSASASEIFAAAIQDYNRGIIIGTNSYGKGTVQSMIDLNRFVSKGQPDLGHVKFTTAMFHRITGGSTQLKGIAPDVTLPEISPLSEVGERAEKYALPWKRIAAAKFTPLHQVTPAAVKQLKQLHETRMQTQPALRDYRHYLAKIAEENKQSVWSLNLEKRQKDYQQQEDFRKNYEKSQGVEIPLLNADKKRKEEIEKRNLAVDEENDKETFVPDVALYESLQIFFDYLQIIAPVALPKAA